MKLDLRELSGIKKELIINETLTFSEEDLKNTEIIKLNPVSVVGKVTKLENDTYNLTLRIKTDMYLSDAITLEEIAYPVDITIDKNINNEFEEGEYYKIVENTLDIFDIVWENIVLEVPLRIVKSEKDTIIEGDGWSLNKPEEKTNPLNELKELLDMEGKR